MIQKVTVPVGSKGPWTIERFSLTEDESKFSSIRFGARCIPAGEYTRLMRGDAIVMSDTPAEMRDHSSFVRRAIDHVLINGLGIGMVLGAVLSKPEVKRVTVVEIDQDVIDLVAGHYACDRLEVVHCSAFDYRPPKGVHYGACWHDIWDDMCGDNLAEMTKLKRKYGRRTNWQGCWGEYETRRRMKAYR